ncbi:MAG TPA: RNA 2',3'-cyclic phosphodiesterase [Thermoleophilaceae bacterium]|nr:RNA 2',3'-cyclic phosphodiesterase [Thermoleophilaceae bacterium]
MEPPPADARPERVRLFVALALPEAVQTELAAWAEDALHGDAALRLVPSEGLHVTLAFLGSRDASAVGEIAAATASAVAGTAAPLLEAGELAPLPRRRPRVIALDLIDPDGRVAALQSAVGAALAEAAAYEPESRRFRPHVTVARVRKGAHPAPRAPLRAPLPPFAATEVVLYRSELGPGGARYTALSATALHV